MKIHLLLRVSVLARSSCLALRILAVVGLIHDLVGERVPSEEGHFGPVGLETERTKGAGGLASRLIAVLCVDVRHDGVRSRVHS